MDPTNLFKADQNVVDEKQLTPRQQSFLKKLKLHDKKVRVSREVGRLVFHGPVIGDGMLPGEAAI